MNMDFNYVFKSILEDGVVKAVGGAGFTIISFLIGEQYLPYMALGVLIVLDIMTKMWSLTQTSGGFSFGLAFKFICSRTMRGKSFHKLFSYAVIIIMANMLLITLPNISFWGISWNTVPVSFACAILAVAESLSILENLMEAGVTVIKPFYSFLKRKEKELEGE